MPPPKKLPRMLAGLSLGPIADRNKETRKRTHPEEFVDDDNEDDDSSSSSSSNSIVSIDPIDDDSSDDNSYDDMSFVGNDYGFYDVDALHELADSNIKPKEEDCTNMIVSIKAVQNGIKEFPCPKCLSIGHLASKPIRHGIICEIEVICTACNNYSMTMEAPEGEKRDFALDKVLDVDEKKNKFFQYGIHYSAVIMQQQLGMGLRGLATILAFLGIYYTVGVGKEKWSLVEDIVGISEHDACKKVIVANLEEEIELTREKSQAKYDAWHVQYIIDNGVEPDEETAQNQWDRCFNLPHMTMYDAWMEKEHGGKKASQLQRRAFLDNLRRDYMVGIGVGGCMDQGWNKRTKSSVDQGSSKTSHNVCIGFESKKIINTVVMSQACRKCDLNKKRAKDGEDPMEHRCPLNYNKNLSSKSMEGNAAVRHVEEIYKMGVDEDVSVRVALSMICTDDDATTRANVKHSYEDTIRIEHPDAPEDDQVLKRKAYRELYDYPETGTSKGKVPIDVPPVIRELADHNHRVKNMAKLMFALSAPGSPLAKHWNSDDSKRMKRYMNRFFNDEENVKLPIDEFQTASLCIIYHYFDQHQYCEARWCGCKKIMDDAVAGNWSAEKLESELEKFKKENNKIYRKDYDPSVDGKKAEDANDTMTKDDNHDTPMEVVEDEQKPKAKEKAKEKKEPLPMFPMSEGRGKKKTTVKRSVFGIIKAKLMSYLTKDMLLQMHHPYATQMNEAFNRIMSAVAPKDRFYGGTCSLEDRNCLAVVEHSEGYQHGLSKIFDELGLQIPYTLLYWAHIRDREEEKRRVRDSDPATKSKRAEHNFAGKCNARSAANNAKKDKTDYKSGAYAFKI